MSCSSARGQTEPLAALLAVLVIGAGLALYAGVLEEELDVDPQRNVATATLEHVEAHLSSGAVVDPRRLQSIDEPVPSGYASNVTVETEGKQWSFGPTPARGADRTSRTVSVRTGPASVVKGHLRVVVWK